MYNSKLLSELSERGFIHQITDADGLDRIAATDGQIIPAYIGFDPTAPSLHVGNLVSIMLLRRLQHYGHKPIVVIGGGTAQVGDPSGKNEMRQMLSHGQIESNITRIRNSFARFLKFGDGPSDAIMVNNADWMESLGYVSFLREIGQHFTINRMLSFDSVKGRLEKNEPLSFLEFNYMIFQANDFLELSRRSGCKLQMGGADQWGNIINGIELARRVDGTSLFGLTTPLITRADGTKMGKTAAGAVWLNPEALSAYEYYQFWRNVPDGDVARFLKLFTDLPVSECIRIGSLKDAEINSAKVILAYECTRLAHGEEAAVSARKTAVAVFSGSIGTDLPRVEVSRAHDLLTAIIALGFVSSKAEARRKTASGAIRINGDTILDPDFIMKSGMVVSFGKKRHGAIV